MIDYLTDAIKDALDEAEIGIGALPTAAEDDPWEYAPAREPMRPRNRPRRMRPTGPARRTFQPDLGSLLEAAESVDLIRAPGGRFADLTGRAVDQAVARGAARDGLIVPSNWQPPTGERCFVTADMFDRIEETRA